MITRNLYPKSLEVRAVERQYYYYYCYYYYYYYYHYYFELFSFFTFYFEGPNEESGVIFPSAVSSAAEKDMTNPHKRK